jgi:hypothetical protein
MDIPRSGGNVVTDALHFEGSTYFSIGGNPGTDKGSGFTLRARHDFGDGGRCFSYSLGYLPRSFGGRVQEEVPGWRFEPMTPESTSQMVSFGVKNLEVYNDQRDIDRLLNALT